MAGFAGQRIEGIEAAIELAHHRIEHTLGNRRVATVAVQRVPLFVEVFEHVRLQVCAGAHVHDFKDRGQGKVMVYGGVA